MLDLSRTYKKMLRHGSISSMWGWVRDLHYYMYVLFQRLDRLDYEPSDCFQGSYDASAEIEVDSTYNTDHDQQLGQYLLAVW